MANLPLPPLWRKSITAGWVEFPSGGETIRGYLAAPRAPGKHPAIVMVHENLGVTQHRQEMTERLAERGYVVLTVDLFSREGGQPPQDFVDPEDRRAKAFKAARDEQSIPDCDAGLDYLLTRDDVDPARLGTVGYCMGGGTMLAWVFGRTDRLKAAVGYYPNIIVFPQYRPDNAPLNRIPDAHKLTCPLQVQFGEQDHAVPQADQEALKAEVARRGLDVDFVSHADAGHAFQDPSIPSYNKAAADRSWEQGIAFLDARLK
jgi:Dienelactone hydrolase and related enzymes